jgi:hypothetical protein
LAVVAPAAEPDAVLPPPLPRLGSDEQALKERRPLMKLPIFRKRAPFLVIRTTIQNVF